jgi:polyisoprenoid-binding protein YceI
MLKLFSPLIILLGFSFSLLAQPFTINQEQSEVTITGTSTIHDWESVAEEFSGTADITVEEGSLTSIQSLTFNVVVDGIKSGKGGMDSKTYGALNEKKHPNIVFELSEVAEINESSVTANGFLTISGTTNPVELIVDYQLMEDGTIQFTGSKKIKMTDYNVDPPTAVLGTIKAGNEVVVHFDASFVANNSMN